MSRLTQPWWERWPERFDFEMEELRRIGAEFTIDQQRFSAGLLRLHITRVGGRAERLIVDFPDSYPYFRFEVRSPGDRLQYHQHPYSRTLCLYGRATREWRFDEDWLARAIDSRVPEVRRVAQITDPAAASALEQNQAEPYSDYYPRVPGTVLLVSSQWRLPAGVAAGTFDVRVMAPSDHGLLRGTVVTLRDHVNREIASADHRLAAAMSSVTIHGHWIRRRAPIPLFDPVECLREIQRLDPRSRHNQFRMVLGQRLRLWGVLFPEETARRTSEDVGWLFVVEREPGGLAVGNPFNVHGILQ